MRISCAFMTRQAWPPSNAWAMKGMNLIRNLSVAFLGAKEHHPGTRNHGVAHERPHREADRTGRAGLPRLARTHRPPRVRRMVRSDEHTSELQSLMRISYALFC